MKESIANPVLSGMDEADETILPVEEADETALSAGEADETDLSAGEADEIALSVSEADETDLPMEEADEIALPMEESDETDLPAGEADESAPPELPSDNPPTDMAQELARLREQVTSLRETLASQKAAYQRAGAEYAEFFSLFPAVSLSALPDDVWQSVQKGVPLAAAYALEERRAAVQAEKAQKVNQINREKSSGALNPTGNSDNFSLAEVRDMTPDEVRANFDKIMESVTQWH